LPPAPAAPVEVFEAVEGPFNPAGPTPVPLGPTLAVPLTRELPPFVPEAGPTPIPVPRTLGPHSPIPVRPLVPGPVAFEGAPEALPVQPLLPEPVAIVHDLKRQHSPMPRPGLIPTPSPFGPTPLGPGFPPRP